MRELNTNQSQALWQELIWKEKASRVAWRLKYGHKYPKEGHVPRKQPQQSQPSSASRPGPAPCSPDNKKVQAGWTEIKGGHSQPSMVVGGQELPPKRDRTREARGATECPVGQTRSKGLDMRAAAPHTLQLLFHGISHDGQGRVMYLRERYRQKPRDKFEYPILSSWEYGWHVEDAIKEHGAPKHARSQPITKVFYLRNGIFQFPRRTDQLM